MQPEVALFLSTAVGQEVNRFNHIPERPAISNTPEFFLRQRTIRSFIRSLFPPGTTARNDKPIPLALIRSASHPSEVRFLALATDYDGTLATHGTVDRNTIGALARLRESGRASLLVTGRELPDLQRVFQRIDLFDRVVAENGALIYRPQAGEQELLCAPASSVLVEQLRAEGIPHSVGRAIVATSDTHAAAVQRIIRDMALDLHVSLNKGSLMVLPSGVDKSFGLNHALAELSLKPENVVAIGDAENDFGFLAACGFGVAVANALPELKLRADLVTSGAHGAGVAEVIDYLLADDLAGVISRNARTH